MFRRLYSTAKTHAKPQVVDIAIVGGGPAGLTLASAIKNSPILSKYKCVLLEGSNLVEPLERFHQTPPEQLLNRVVSITPASAKFLRKIGAWDHILHERIQPYSHIITYDGVSGSKLEMDSTDSEEMAIMIENTNIQNGAYHRLKELNALSDNKLEVLDNTKVKTIEGTGEQWPVLETENGDKIQARLLIGCDGNNSPVRKFAQIESRGWAYNKWGIVGTMKYHQDNLFREPTGWQRFLPTGTLAFLPMPDNWCSFVWVVPTDLSNVLMKLDDDQFMAIINAGQRLSIEEMDALYEIADKTPEELIDQVNWRLELYNKSHDNSSDLPVPLVEIIAKSRGKFPLKMTHADSYVDHRVALVGDAAHTTNPLAGQGLNMGQSDAQCLVETLEVATNRGLDIGQKMALEPYFAERYLPNHILLGVVDKIHKIHTTSLQPVVWARSLGVDILQNLPIVKDWLVGTISKK